MKVQVTLQVSVKSGTTKTLDMVVFATDTVWHLKNRIASANAFPCQSQDLILQGKVLQDDCKLSECGVQEGSSLGLILQGCEFAFVSELVELLRHKSVVIEELCLLYVHKHGISTRKVLEAIGFDGTLQEFLQKHKPFQIEDGSASVLSDNITLKLSMKSFNPHAWIEDDSDASTATIEIVVGREDTISSAKARVASSFDVVKAFPHLDFLFKGLSLDDSQQLSVCGLHHGANLELVMRASETSLVSQLLELLKAHEAECGLTIDQLGHLYICKYGVAAEEVLASFTTMLRRRRLRDFLVQQSQWFTVTDARVTPVIGQNRSGEIQECSMSQHKRCLELHGRISSFDFRSKVARTLNSMVAAIMELSFLGIHQVVTGGAAGKGIAIEGDAGAEVTLFLEKLPQAGQEKWPVDLLESIAKALQDLVIEDMPTIQTSYVGNHGLRLTCDGFPDVELRISPVFGTHSQALDSLAAQMAMSQPVHAVCLAKEEVKFMKKQPEPIKVTARLLKWWRNQQQWSLAATRPSDHLLELLAVHVAAQLPPKDPYDQGTAIGLAAKLMSNFNEAQITWPSPAYGRHRISEEILRQRPLLADPCNPFVNVASPMTFDPKEMIAYTKSCRHLLF